MSFWKWLLGLTPSQIAKSNERFTTGLTKKLSRLSDKEIATILALCIDHRNYILAHYNTDIFQLPEFNKIDKDQFEKAAKALWIYMGRSPHNKSMDLSRRVTMSTTAHRDQNISYLWRELIRGQAYAQAAARQWERKHNQMLRIDDPNIVSQGLSLDR